MKTNPNQNNNENPSDNDIKNLYSEHRFEHRIDHGLCLIWHELEKGNTQADPIKEKMVEAIDTRVFDELTRSGLILEENNLLEFTETGKTIAADIVRRRRLAERLFEDVLEIPKGEVESRANEFEHLIDRHVEESICILLGHPRECPHGFAIPPGKCCADKEDQLESIVASLDHFEPGESGRVTYIITRNHPQLHKLMSLGIVPGTLIHVHQVYPSFVIKVEETQLALEQKVAENIYLRRL